MSAQGVVVWHPGVVAQYAAGSEAVGELLAEANDGGEVIVVSGLALACWAPADATQVARVRILMSFPHVSLVPVALDWPTADTMLQDHWDGTNLAELHTVRLMWDQEPGSHFALPARPGAAQRVLDHLPRSTRVLRLVEPPPVEGTA